MQKKSISVALVALCSAVATPHSASADDAKVSDEYDVPQKNVAQTTEEPKRREGAGPVLAPLSSSSASDEEPKRYPPSSTRWKLILGGVGLTGVAYGATLASSLIWPDVPGSGAMKIPIAGPWIALGQNKCAADSPDCGAILYVRGALEILSGIVQASGLGLVGEGIFMTTEAEGKPKSARPMILPVPIVSGSTTGFGVIGTF